MIAAAILVMAAVQLVTTIALVKAFRGMRDALLEVGQSIGREPATVELEQALERPTAAPLTSRDQVEGFSRALAVARVNGGVLPSFQQR